MPLYNLGNGIFTLCLALTNVRENRNECKILTRTRVQQPGNVFEKEGVKNYSMIAFDTSNQQLVATAIDTIFLVRLADLQMIEEATWAAEGSDVSACSESAPRDACRNHIKVLHVKNQKIFACGTFAMNSLCSWRNLGDIKTPFRLSTGYRKSPFAMEQSTTSVMTEDEYLYSGMFLDTHGMNWAITKTKDNNFLEILETDFTNEWMWEPTFIASFEIGGFVYFFFNEKGHDASSFQENIYPRIARVCKKDTGSDVVRKTMWLTYQKARMECTIGGDRALQLRLQSITFSPGQYLFFGLFNTHEGAIDGSAICEYTMSMVNTTFQGPFAAFDKGACKFSTHEEQDMANYRCEDSGILAERSKNPPRVLNYKLMAYALRSRSSHPLILSNNNRYDFMETLSVFTRQNGVITELLLANKKGLVSKLAILRHLITEDSDQVPTCLFDTYNLFPPESNSTILTMKYFEGTKSLYFGTNDKLIRVDTSLCERFTSRDSCLLGGDPHCGWNARESKCTSPPDNNPTDKDWSQNEIKCAVPPNDHDKEDESTIAGGITEPEISVTELPTLPVDPDFRQWRRKSQPTKNLVPKCRNFFVLFHFKITKRRPQII